MKVSIPFLLIVLYLLSVKPGNTLFASHIEIKDTIFVNTIWSVDTVKITGDLFLPDGNSLTIAPGTRVEFQGNYSLIFKGLVSAIGDENDSIIFTINDTSGFHDLTNTNGAWRLISGAAAYNQATYFQYCIFEYAKNLTGDFAISLGKQITSTFSYNTVQNLYSKKSALYVDRGVIYKCKIRNNLCSAVFSGNLSDCFLTDNYGNGIILTKRIREYEDDSKGSICTNNIFRKNKDYAIKIDAGHLNYVYGNTIDNNGGGIYMESGSSEIINNVISNNYINGAINMNAKTTKVIANLIFNNTIHTEDSLDSTGAGIHIFNSDNINVYNNTIVRNHGTKTGGISLVNFKNAKVYNNILWENSTKTGNREAAFISDQLSVVHNLSLRSNIIKSGIHAIEFSPDIIVDSATQISNDPQFVNIDGNDFSLTVNSPSRNKGKNLTYPDILDFPKLDHAGKYRIMCNIIDIGAYEFQPDSTFIVNLIPDDTTVYCSNTNKAIYLRSAILWNPYDPHKFIFQWQKNGIDIEGATYEDLYIRNVSENDFGNYSVVVGGYFAGPRTYSFNIINTLGEINSGSIAVSEGSDTTIRLKNVINEPVNFQWYKNGLKLSDTTQNISLLNLHSENEGYYYCVISNDCATTITDSIFMNVLTECEIHSPGDTVFNINTCSGYHFNGAYLISSGTYMDTIPNVAGCDSIITLNLVITDIDTSVTETISGLCVDMSDAEYQWLNCGNNYSPISGETDQTFLPVESGDYAVIVTKNNCSDTSACHSFYITGFRDINSEEAILVYPNPLKTSATIILKNQSSGIDEIRLVNMIGEVVFRASNIQSNTYQIQKGNIKPGTYVIIIMSGSDIYRQNITIE
jgi:hypothetical protein